MILINKVTEALDAQVELVETRLRAFLPEGSFVLAVNVDAPTLVTLTMWRPRSALGAYNLPRALLVSERPRELESAIDHFITLVRAHA